MSASEARVALWFEPTPVGSKDWLQITLRPSIACRLEEICFSLDCWRSLTVESVSIGSNLVLTEPTQPRQSETGPSGWGAIIIADINVVSPAVMQPALDLTINVFNHSGADVFLAGYIAAKPL